MARDEILPDTLLGGKIRLIKRIGRGGMGDVWVARNEATEAEVAVKTLHRSERTSVHDERFRREARLSATISHRNVVRVFDLIDEQDGTLGLVMELLRGGTLEDAIRERAPMSSVQALAIVLPVLSAMHHVHQKGIVHRDVKPANIFFAVEPDGHVIPKVLDFGIAKLPAAGSALTIDGSVLGTPHYMSPEQIRGQEDIDGRSDMFSVAVLLYEMLTGVRVFQRETAAGSLASVLEHEVDPDPRIDPRLWIAVSRSLAKRSYERYATCGEFAEALRASFEATDDDLAEALQQMRPPGSVQAPAMTSTRPSSVEVSTAHADRLPMQRWSAATRLLLGSGAAVLVLVGVLLLTLRKPSPMSATSAASPPTLAAATDPRAIDPPLPSPVESARAPALPHAPTVEATPTQQDRPPLAVTKSTLPPVRRPVTSATAHTNEKKPPPKPRGSAGGVATTPGF